MQAIFPEGPGPVEPFDPATLEQRLKQGAQKVEVFKEGSEAHRLAIKADVRLTRRERKKIKARLGKA